MSGETIVVVEDENDILEMIAYNLEREGYRVHTARDGETGLELIRRETPELVLLDLMLPGLDGVEICRQIKLDPMSRDTRVIMVTAKTEESDVVLGLGIGADDYVPKPFSPRELVARVKAVLRRGPVRDAEPGAERIVLGGLAIDPSRHQVVVDQEEVRFTATEFRLLHYLASHPGRVFTREQLINRVIGDQAMVIDRNIDVHVRVLRRKLGRYSERIETVRGVGYRFSDRRD